MAENEDPNLKLLLRGIRGAIRGSASVIEHIAGNLDNIFDGLGADQLPEYKAAMDAIKAYEEALVARFAEKYNESRRG